MSYLSNLEQQSDESVSAANTSDAVTQEVNVEQKQENTAGTSAENSDKKSDFHSKKFDRSKRGFKGGERKFKRREHDENEKISVLSLRRVAKVREGSNRLSFSALVVSGDMKGSFGIASTKAREASLAIQRAAAKARKLKKTVKLLDGRTLFQDVEGSYCATKVLIRRAKPGTGIVAGKIVRAILECLGGSKLDVVTKVYGSRNPLNVAKAVLVALSEFMDD